MATDNDDDNDSDPRDGINYKEIQSLLNDQKTKGEKIKYLAGELGILADRFDSVNGKVFWLLSQHGLRGSTLESALERLNALERKQASQQAWGDNFDRVMALVESKVRKVQEAVDAGMPAKTDIEVLRAHCSRLHRENCDVANVLTRVQQEVAQLAESVRKDHEVVKHTLHTHWNEIQEIKLCPESFTAAPALDPRLAKYLENGGKYLLVEPVDSAAGREWKAAVLRETENDDAPDEYGNAFAASPGEAVAALVAKLVKFKEL